MSQLRARQSSMKAPLLDSRSRLQGANGLRMVPWTKGATVLAPAKVNLSLRIVSRRPDSYHELESVMVPIDLCDRLLVESFMPRGGRGVSAITVDSDNAEIPSGPDNLVFKAAAAFAAASGRAFALSVRIDKRIPSGAGLGGGSSDGAAVLLGLNGAFGEPLSCAELNSLAAEIGADLPFFLACVPARVTGIGEQLTPFTGPVPRDLVLCGDGTVLSTKAVFAAYDAALTIADSKSSVANSAGAGSVGAEFCNDLESAAAGLNPGILARKRELLRNGARVALMTGSGSVVFGVMNSRDEAERASLELRAAGFWAEAVRTMIRPTQAEYHSGR